MAAVPAPQAGILHPRVLNAASRPTSTMAMAIAAIVELFLGRVQSQQDPDRRRQDQRRDDILRVGGDRRSDQQGRGHEGCLLYPGDLPFGSIELRKQPHREDDSDKGAVAELGDWAGNALDALEPPDDQGDEAEPTPNTITRTAAHALNAIRRLREREAADVDAFTCSLGIATLTGELQLARS